MRPWRLRLDKAAELDLQEIDDWLTQRASPAVADRYLERIRRYLAGFAHLPHRGTPREDIRPGLRVTGFERRLTIIFEAVDGEVTILRVLSGGRDPNAAMGQLQRER